MAKWGDEYDGYQTANKKTHTHKKFYDKFGRQIPEKPSQDKAIKRFRENIDLDNLELFMGEHEKYNAFLFALRDPDHARLTFSTICRKFGVTLHELQVIYNDGMRHVGLLGMSNKLPQVMEDVAEDSLAHQVLCTRCDGKRVIVEILARDDQGVPTRTQERECPACEGVGKVRQVGDKHARDLVFESMKLTKQGGGSLVAITQNFGDPTGLNASMERMLKLTQGIVMGAPPKHDAQPQEVENVNDV